jgi:signal transduction histidine kinase
MPVPHDAVATVGQFQVLPLGDEGIGFRNQHLGQHSAGAFTCNTDEKALHHLFAEVIDNAMDEALAGHATFIEVELAADGTLAVTDNGRGIPVDPHPKFPKKSALEVVHWRRDGPISP